MIQEKVLENPRSHFRLLIVNFEKGGLDGKCSS